MKTPIDQVLGHIRKIRPAVEDSMNTGKAITPGICLALGQVEAILATYSPVSLDRHKEHLLRNGWSYRAAALALGVSTQWLNTVLNGWQISETLADRILGLGQCPDELMSAKARNRMEALR